MEIYFFKMKGDMYMDGLELQQGKKQGVVPKVTQNNMTPSLCFCLILASESTEKIQGWCQVYSFPE